MKSLLSVFIAGLLVSGMSSCGTSEAKQRGNRTEESKLNQVKPIAFKPNQFIVVRARTDRGTTIFVKLNAVVASLIKNGDRVPVKPFDSNYFMIETNAQSKAEITDCQSCRK